MSQNVCRFCKKHDTDDALVRYALRCYAHGHCLYLRRGIGAIASLRAWQIGALPVLPMKRAGVSYASLSAMHNAALLREATS